MLPASFALVLFMSGTAALVWLGILLAQSVTRQHLAFVGKLLASTLFLLPVTMPGLSLIHLQTQWLEGFVNAARVWRAGVVLALILSLSRWFVCLYRVRRYPVYDSPKAIAALCHCAEQMNIKKKPRMVRSERHGVAGVFGISRPIIVVNPAMLELLVEDEAAWVFRHELTHLRRRHALWLRAMDLLCCVHWYNPFAWIAKRGLELSIEMDCDARVLLRCPDANGYARALVSVLNLRWCGKVTGPPLGISGYALVRQRFERLAKPPVRFQKAAVWIIAAAFE